MRPTRSAGPSAIYANILVNNFPQMLISFFLGQLSAMRMKHYKPNPRIQRTPTSTADFDCSPRRFPQFQ